MIFIGVSLLGREECAVWLMPIGALLDQWEAYKHFHGIAKQKVVLTIDELIPGGI